MLTAEVERRFPVALVHLRGRLDQVTAPAACATLLGCLTEQPTTVVVDVGDLVLTDDAALALLPAICRRAALWPGAAVLFCGPRPAMVKALDRLVVTRLVRVYGTQEEALAVADRRPVPPRVTEVLPPDRYAPARAREVVHEACREWGLLELAPLAQLLATELVSNGVMHAGTPLAFSVILRGGNLYVAVRDEDPQPVRIGTATGTLDEHGRGLLVVDSLAAAWGSLPTQDGKVVWAAVRVPQDETSYV
ncbi:MAG TPA: ATP-binding protein [Micromonosporaceae bacterium]|nr:ATP-binding protein [Micromonosporaceae bacterium]